MNACRQKKNYIMLYICVVLVGVEKEGWNAPLCFLHGGKKKFYSEVSCLYIKAVTLKLVTACFKINWSCSQVQIGMPSSHWIILPNWQNREGGSWTGTELLPLLQHKPSNVPGGCTLPPIGWKALNSCS